MITYLLLSILTVVLQSNVTETRDTSSYLNCYYYNATSIRGKLKDFNQHFDPIEYDIVSVTETWCNDSVLRGELFTNGGYNVFRKDRNKNTVPDKDDGGGVLLAVKLSLNAKRRSDLETCMEMLWVEITLDKNRSLLVGTCYMNYPSPDLVDKFERSLEKVALAKSDNHSVVIFGDYNMSDIRWAYEHDSSVASITNKSDISPLSSYFSEVLDIHALDQCNVFPSQPQLNNNVVDLVLCNHTSVIVEHATKATESTHVAFQVYINTECTHKTVNVSRTVYNFKRADFTEINNKLQCMHLGGLHLFHDVNESLSHVYDILFSVMKDCVPTQRINHKHYPYWFDRETITLIKQKHKVHRDYVRGGRDKKSRLYRRFCELRREVKLMQKSKFNEYVENIGEEMKSNSKRFWTFVKSLKGISSLPSTMFHCGNEYNSHASIANGFSLFFKSVFQVNTDVIPPCDIRDTALFRMKPIQPDEMLHELKNIKRHTSTGSDNMPAIFLINTAESICVPLCTIFNLSVTSGIFPDILKLNNIIPIYKRKGDKNDIENYRGISLQPILAKVFERLIKKRLQPHIKSLISENQHGFVPKKSCFTNLACYSDYIAKHMDMKHDIHSVYTDFRKAFDSVPFNLLLHKLYCRFGVHGKELKWFQSYLDNRYQRVIMNGIESAWVKVTSGVPQGSILGPLLFIMYIDDLCQVSENSESLFFADDGKMYRFITCIADCVKFQCDLSKVYEWSLTWRINLHFDKCFSICFSNRRSNKITYLYKFGNHAIESVQKIKDLGVFFTSNLNFKCHIEFTVSKALKMLGFVYRTTKHFNDNSVMVSLYKSLVRSRLEYCSSIWSPSQEYLIAKLERVQKRLARWLCYRDKVNYRAVGYNAVCEKYNLQSLESRRNISDLCNLNKIYNNNVNSTYLVSQVTVYVPTRRLRRNRLFSAESRLNIRKNSFIPRVLSLANSYNEVDIFEYDKSVFKRKVVSIFH